MEVLRNDERGCATRADGLFAEPSCLRAPQDPLYFEGQAWASGSRRVAGVDEAGRGALAGPVVAAAVILPERPCLDGVRDSKQMSPPAREKGFLRILESALRMAVGVVSPEVIDRTNILSASLEAMRLAVSGLDPLPDLCLVDGIFSIPIDIRQVCLKKGDQRSLSISAASVVAKVYRDRIMVAHHQGLPYYGFDRHKGYGTRAHLHALEIHGPSPIHRVTFAGVAGHDPGEA